MNSNCCWLAGMVIFVVVITSEATASGFQGGYETFNTVHFLTSDFTELSIKENYDLQIFCRIGDKKTPVYFFRSATLRINSVAEEIKLIKGGTPGDVYSQYRSSTWLFWMANFMPWRMRDANLPTFNTSCVGISTDQPYTAKLVLRYADPTKVAIFCAGVFLFFMSAKLAKSTTFFYSSATVVGALGAAVLLLFIVTKFLPRGRGSYITLSVLYSILLYFAGETWNRFEQLIQERLPYVIVYLSLGALFSLISCYRFGPPTNYRTLNIIQWSLQVFGLALIHLSSDLIEVSTCIIVGIVSYCLLREKVHYCARKMKFKMFPPKRKFISEEDFIAQGAIETEKGLEELRKFCNSPDCNAWKIVSRLQNPKRFSGFMEGSPHLNDDEILAYDSENEALEEAAAADLLTDDENSPNVTDDES